MAVANSSLVRRRRGRSRRAGGVGSRIARVLSSASSAAASSSGRCSKRSSIGLTILLFFGFLGLFDPFSEVFLASVEGWCAVGLDVGQGGGTLVRGGCAQGADGSGGWDSGKKPSSEHSGD